MATLHDNSASFLPGQAVEPVAWFPGEDGAPRPGLFSDPRHEPLVEYAAGPAAFADGPGQRAFDLVLALSFIIILSPVMLFTALLVWTTSPGPLMFRHVRVGRYGAPFVCLKFRTMAVAAEDRLRDLLARDEQLRCEWECDQKMRCDPRVTPVGKVLRRFSLDELPQLFNVVRGDMSIVGPRPIVAAEIERYAGKFCYYCAVRPGLTGLWQISGRNHTTYERRVELDCEYARAKSIRGDALIILRTIPEVVRGTGY